MSNNSSISGRSPRAKARKQLMEKYHSRGSFRSNLWLYFSPKTNKDWTVSSDLEMDHAYLLEALPHVLDFDLAPPATIVKVGDDDYSTTFDAIVSYRDGSKKVFEVKPSQEEKSPSNPRTLMQRQAQVIAAQKLGAVREIFTDEHANANEMLITNWRRVVPYLAATRFYPMGEMNAHVALRLHTMRCGTIGDAMRGIDQPFKPVFLSAFFAIHQSGKYQTNLDSEPLSLGTKFWLAEDQK